MDIVTFESPLMPGKPMFRCDRLRADLQVATCVGMWKQANAGKASPERLHRCVQCKVGESNAGESGAAMNPIRGSTTCARCHRTDLRLIGANICVGCMNRQYEWIKGRNAKGNFPKQHKQLVKRTLRYVVAGEVRVLTRVHTVELTELVIELLRDSAKQVMMGRGRGNGVMQRQGVLL